jgi:hypothetical protein
VNDPGDAATLPPPTPGKSNNAVQRPYEQNRDGDSEGIGSDDAADAPAEEHDDGEREGQGEGDAPLQGLVDE